MNTVPLNVRFRKEVNPLFQHHPLKKILAMEESRVKHNLIGFHHSSREHTPASINKAEAAYRKAVAMGDIKAYHAIGMLYNDVNNAKAAEWFTKGHEAGDIASTTKLGVAFYTGKGVSRNIVKAVELFKLNKHSPLSNTILGLIYLSGDGVAVDYALALAYLKKGFMLRSMFAAQWVGLMYDRGLGVPKDEEKAIYYLQKAADAGVPDAQKHMDTILRKSCVPSRMPPCNKGFTQKDECCYKDYTSWLEKASNNMVRRWPLHWPLLSVNDIARQNVKQLLRFALEVFQTKTPQEVQERAHHKLFEGRVGLLPILQGVNRTLSDSLNEEKFLPFRFLLLPINIADHRNVLLVDKQFKRAWYIEPHEYKKREDGASGRVLSLAFQTKIPFFADFSFKRLSYKMNDVKFQLDDDFCTLWAPIIACLFIHFNADVLKMRMFVRQIPIPVQLVYSAAHHMYEDCSKFPSGLTDSVNVTRIWTKINANTYQILPDEKSPEETAFIQPLLQSTRVNFCL